MILESEFKNNPSNYCKNSIIGQYKCLVQTKYGWCCDVCLEEELLYLNSIGVETINSCCGHGNFDLAVILVYGNNSRSIMESMGYELINDVCEYNITWWKPKSNFVYLEGVN